MYKGIIKVYKHGQLKQFIKTGKYNLVKIKKYKKVIPEIIELCQGR